ncbi:kinase-like domain-containing protein [Mycena vitilis]|nr:kinase-like domain-containing protein [Mycena vitilis]
MSEATDATDAMPGPGELAGLEFWWRDHQVWLEQCGYMLRPRYKPDWIPSWTADPTIRYMCEDSIPLSGGETIDATRMEDGALVILKVISKTEHPHEASIFQYLSSPELASDPRNRCIPLLDQLSPPDDEDSLIFVMKFMRLFDSPRFETFGEVVQFFGQIFEGLQFMHHHRVAHRDCNSTNIMMDGQHLFPEGFHPQFYVNKRDAFERAKYCTRTERPVRYYFIDFGISRKFEPGEETREYPIEGGDASVPEFEVYKAMSTPSKPDKLDPFPTDIYYLGNLIRTEFIEGFPPMNIPRKYGFGFMKKLVSDMVQDDPTKRPDIDEVVARFDKIQRRLSSWKLRSRVVKEGEITPVHLGRVARHWWRRVKFILNRVPAIPSPKP